MKIHFYGFPEIFTCQGLHLKCPPQIPVLNVYSQLLTWEDHQSLKNVAEGCHQRWIYKGYAAWLLVHPLLHGLPLMRSSLKSCICELRCFHYSFPAGPQLSETPTQLIGLWGLWWSLCNTISFPSTWFCLASPILFPLYFFSPLLMLLLPGNLSVLKSLSLSHPSHLGRRTFRILS